MARPRRPLRGTCSACGRKYRLRRDGSVASHKPRGATDRWAECPGSGRTATEYASDTGGVDNA